MPDANAFRPLEIAHLADHPAIIPTLAHWFRAQWPNYYAQRSQAEIEQDFQAEARRAGLPLRLIAFQDGVLAGTIVLRQHALATLAAFQPGLGGLLVAEAFRGRGIGARLIQSGMDAARTQGYRRIYTATAVAGSILTRLGWELVQIRSHDGEQLGVYCCELAQAG